VIAGHTESKHPRGLADTSEQFSKPVTFFFWSKISKMSPNTMQGQKHAQQQSAGLLQHSVYKLCDMGKQHSIYTDHKLY
jgi:hypothetical protein